MEKIKQNFYKFLEKVLSKFLKDLTWMYVQLSKGGVNSEKYIYMYNDKTKLYIKNIWESGVEYITTVDVDEAKDFEKMFERNIILWLINYNKSKEDRFRFRNILRLSGGNFGANATNIDISNQS